MADKKEKLKKSEQTNLHLDSNLKDDFPTLEDMMFNNINAIKSHKKKKHFKNKHAQKNKNISN